MVEKLNFDDVGAHFFFLFGEEFKLVSGLVLDGFYLLVVGQDGFIRPRGVVDLEYFLDGESEELLDGFHELVGDVEGEIDLEMFGEDEFWGFYLVALQDRRFLFRIRRR